MRMPIRERNGSAQGKWVFLMVFTFSCFLFWWLPSMVFRLLVHQSDLVEDRTVAISIIALLLFVAGYLVPARTRSSDAEAPNGPLVDACGRFAYALTALLFLPSMLVALERWHSSFGVVYGEEGVMPRSFQALLYTHLFFGFMFLGAAEPEKEGWRRVVIATTLLTLPRFVISLHGSRFFLAQAAVPALLIAFARGWLRFSLKRAVQLLACMLVILFLPAITRGDALFGQEESVQFLAAGSSLRLFQDNMELDLTGRCPPLVVALTAKTIPFGFLGVCVMDIYGLRNMPATLSRILTINDPSTFEGTVGGTGSNYLLDLYLSGGIAVVYVGSAIFGLSCRRFAGWIERRSLFAGIWAECLTRALFAPRNDLGYVYERIPSLVLATVLVMLFVGGCRLLAREFVGGCGPNETQNRFMLQLGSGTLRAMAPETVNVGEAARKDE
jgi:hypothetical protein